MVKKLKEKSMLLSDDELDKAAGGRITPNNGSRYGNPGCSGPQNCDVNCYGCSDYVQVSSTSRGPRGTFVTTISYKCRHMI